MYFLSMYCPKSTGNPITVTPIWKWWIANGAHPIWFTMHCSLTAKEVKFRLHMKDYKWGRNGSLKVGKIVTEVICKSNYSNHHLQMGQNPITIAKVKGAKCISISVYSQYQMHYSFRISSESQRAPLLAMT